jgi:D-cysteine desulfhydrase
VPILFKRDDLTGFGLGGNKTRGLEYLLADALRQGCDSLVTGAGPQSNWTVLAALAAKNAGLTPYVVCYGDPPEPSGNLLLHRTIGTELHFTGDPERSSVDRWIAAEAGRLRAAGHRPYVVPRGGATGLGALGYVRACVELAGQLAELPRPPAELWLATGSGGTHAGLAAGAAILATPYRVTGVTVSRPVPECRARVEALAVAAAGLAGYPDARPVVDVRGGWIGPGYGLASAAGDAAARLVVHTEGIWLDPVFGAKAMAALIDGCRSRTVTGPVVFVVGGGVATLFAATVNGTNGDGGGA